MRTLLELQYDFQQLEDRVSQLEKLPLNSDQLTLGDVTSLVRQMNALKSDLSTLSSPKQSPARPPAPQQNWNPNYRDFKTAKSLIADRLQRKSRITEENIGKYFISVLAAILVLLAVGLIAGSFWEYMPDVLKLIVLLAAGATCELVGWKKISKEGKKNGFWAGVTGLGAAIVFVSIVFGSLFWQLYPSLVVISGLILWFAGHLFLSTKANSNVFYAITYFGGFLATALTFANRGSNSSGELTVITVTALFYAVGAAGTWKSKNPMLPVLNCLFLWGIFLQTRYVVTIPYSFDGHVQELTAAYIPYSLVIFQLCLSGLLIIGAPKVLSKNWKISRIGTIVLSLLSSIMVIAACSDMAHFFHIDLWMELVALFIICAAGVLHFKDRCEYLLGAAPIIALILSQLSGDYLYYAPILPSLVTLICLCIPAVRRQKILKISAVVLYAVAFLGMGEWNGGVALWAGVILLMAVPIVNYALIWLLNDGLYPAYELLAGSILPALALYPLIDNYDLSNMIGIACLTGFVLYNRTVIPYRRFTTSQEEFRVEHAALVIVSIISCLAVYANGIFPVDPIDLTLVPLVLLTYSFLAVRRAIRLPGKLPSIFSSIFCHLNISCVVSMWKTGNENLIITCFGFLLAALFIAIGFWKKQKSIRICGLVFLIGYVLKVALLDASQSGDVATRILGLLVGGVVCFVVSFSYNKLNKLYGELGQKDHDAES